MSKKNNLENRRKQHRFDLQREKQEKEKKLKRLQAKSSKMKMLTERYNKLENDIDGSDTKKKRKSGGFQVGKRKLKTRLSALAKAKAAQAMEVDK